jgi:hypothetical protein
LYGGDSSALCGADDEGAAGGLDDIGRDGGQVVDPKDTVDLDEQALHEAEVAAGDAGDSGDGLGVGEVRAVQLPAVASMPPVASLRDRLLPSIDPSAAHADLAPARKRARSVHVLECAPGQLPDAAG